MGYPYAEYVNPPFPSGGFGGEAGPGGYGLGPVYIGGNIPEWSAGASPYYTRGSPVKYKGLVYKLNYNWDGTTVGSPNTQVDADGIRVWTLQCDNYNTGVQQDIIGYRKKTINSDDSYYYVKDINLSIKKYWNYWHNITSAHAVVFELNKYKADNESGFGRNLLSFASTVEISSLKTAYGDDVKEVQSINFDDANGIDNKMFGFVTSSCWGALSFAAYLSPIGIFSYYGNFKYTLYLTDIGTLYYEAPYSYTLTTADWHLSPEFNPTAYGPPLTINWTYTNGDYTRSENITVSDLKMIFGAETFLGRTYTGAYRVYVKDGRISEQRWELDSVSPDMRTM
jgi:hypothetical protein